MRNLTGHSGGWVSGSLQTPGILHSVTNVPRTAGGRTASAHPTLRGWISPLHCADTSVTPRDPGLRWTWGYSDQEGAGTALESRSGGGCATRRPRPSPWASRGGGVISGLEEQEAFKKGSWWSWRGQEGGGTVWATAPILASPGGKPANCPLGLTLRKRGGWSESVGRPQCC